MYCSKCGKEIPEGKNVCENCGAKCNNVENIPPEYKPISMWGYFGYQILFAIPILGWILLLIFALGGARNKNVRNFAASYFCVFIIFIIIIAICASMGVGVSFFEALKSM